MRLVHRVAILFCALNVVVRVAVAAFRARAAAFYEQATAACDADGRDTGTSIGYRANAESSFENQNYAIATSMILETTVLSLMVAASFLFFPACIVMFRRVQRRLDVIITEMDHRTDRGNVFLPYEFSPPAVNVAQPPIQMEMPIGQAREFLGSMKSAAVQQRMQFLSCFFILLLALTAMMMLSLFIARIFLNPLKQNPDCGHCEQCQDVAYLIAKWYANTPEMYALVTSLCSTLPLMLSLWLMTTKDDRALMLNPESFRADAIIRQHMLRPTETERETNLRAHLARMGVNMQ